MLWRGFRFGLMLQFAVGPICLLTFIASSTFGFFAGEAVAVAAALVDAVYIGVSAGSIARLMRNPAVQRRIKAFGAVVLAGFGLYMLNEVGSGVLPRVTLFGSSYLDFFLEGIILTASNPLTILFWGGVFAAQVAEHQLQQEDMVLFGGGCVLSTFLFLSAVAAVGIFAGRFLAPIVILGLNGLVGAMLIYFAFRMWKK
jgi:threonine/homoserine/homoserine lactone efflux protein